ncbi:DUF1127 domain-containing protein [Ruegeria atlantica]|uniref:DUF1127 domain-containing protein n=1 Tax=Ruegeria atlantica TaxID=81569 RepID=UPI00147A8ADB|nr:DUF1127 domain-containing protein [Ruegeria atlantica]
MTTERSSFSVPPSVAFQPIGVKVPNKRGKSSVSIAEVFANLFSQLRSAVIREYRFRRDLRHVSQLDKRMLKDIGLNPELYHKDLRYGRDTSWSF